MRSLFLCIFFFSVVSQAFGQAKISREEYVQKYKDIAIREMKRSGVPASITLAQGILESNAGNSVMALKAKNHFGIKGHRDYNGPCFYADDDAKDECFRMYKTVEQSYVDHSDFLRSNQRYDFLFELDQKDYKKWSHGLRKAGYATNPKYGDLLISLIERYNLSQYDGLGTKGAVRIKPGTSDEIFDYNGIPAIAYDGTSDISTIAAKYYFSEWQVYKYNELKKGQKFPQGTLLYLKPKRRRHKKEKTYKVKEGETLAYISQMKGLKLSRLRKLNRLEKGQEPMAGQVLNLRKKRSAPPKISSEKPNPAFFILGSPVGKPVPKPVKKANEKKDIYQPIEVADGVYHEVDIGQTLSAIARAYGTSIAELRRLNNLKEDNIKVGDVILVKSKLSRENQVKNEKPAVNSKKEEPKVESTKPAEKDGYHTVKAGETLFSISRNYGLTVGELKRLNKNVSTLSVGQQLRLK